MIENLAMHRKTSDPMLKITKPCLKVSSHYFNYYHCWYFHSTTLSHTLGLLDTLEFIRLALAAPWNSSNDLEFSVITYNVLSNKNHADSLLTRLKNFQLIFFHFCTYWTTNNFIRTCYNARIQNLCLGVKL